MKSDSTGSIEAVITTRRFFYWLPAIFYMGFVFFLSSQTGLPLLNYFAWQDKVLHVALYAPLGFLVAYGLASFGSRRNIVLYASFLALLYGATDEFHQWWVPGRDTSVVDVVADGIGALLGGYGYVKVS